MPFSDGSRVVVEAIDASSWRVVEGFSYTGISGTFEVPADSCTDFASVPRFFLWLLPSYGKYTKAAILHDCLWRIYVPRGDLGYVDADGMFRRAMRELQVPFLQRWLMWSAVRWGALMKPGGRKGWLGDSWRVLLMSIIGLPIVAPPAIIIGLAFILWTVLEFVFWVPLKLNRLLRKLLDKPTKRVVDPKINISV